MGQEKLWGPDKGPDCAMRYAHKANGVTAGLLFLQRVNVSLQTFLKEELRSCGSSCGLNTKCLVMEPISH